MADTRSTPRSSRQELRYLLVGGVNTMLGYAIGVACFKLLEPLLTTFAIAIIANIIAITLSFSNLKLFVFRTHGHWLSEGLRSLITYSGMALLSVVAVTVLVDRLHYNIWLAQGITLCLTSVVGYFAHKRFTFAR